ncbi:MAG: hypothetical protein PVF15_09025 [Candidatus Bathyarchaeota archaeon]
MATVRHMWKPLALLSIVVPISLLVTFRLSGILQQPTDPERITLEPATLIISRPSETTERINKSAQNEWTQNGVSVTARIHVFAYLEGAASAPFWSRDGLTLKTYVNASSTNGYFSSMLMSLHPLDNDSLVFLDLNPWSLKALNCSIVNIRDFGVNETDAYIKCNVLNSSCSVCDQIFWVFLDEKNEAHEIRITVEATYTVEAAIKVIAIPLTLRITATEGEG